MIIRRAVPQDASQVANVRVLSWRATYRGIVPDSYLDAMDANVEQWRAIAAGEQNGAELLVCEVDNRVVGFAAYGAARAPAFGHGGELYAIYFLPEATGRGHGRALATEVTAGLRRLGHGDLIVWVMEQNARGRAFYESVVRAVLVEGSRQNFEIGGRTIWEVAYSLRPLPDTAAPR